MEMFFLIIKLSYGSVVMPEKYSKEQCAQIQDRGDVTAYCIPAPNMDSYYNCATMATDPANPGTGKVVKSHCDFSTGKLKND